MTFAVPRSMQVLDLQANKCSQLLPSLHSCAAANALEMSGNEALRNGLGRGTMEPIPATMAGSSRPVGGHTSSHAQCRQVLSHVCCDTHQ